MAFNVMEALQAFGAGRQMALQERQFARQEAQLVRQDQGRRQVGEQIRAGDFTGAAATAFDAGLGDDVMQSVQRLNQAQRGQAQMEAAAGLAAARALRGVPMEQRGGLVTTLTPRLREAGFSDEELAALTQDLSDGTLDGHISFTQGLVQQLSTGQRGATPTNDQRMIEYYHSIGRPDIASAIGNRRLTRAVPVTNPDGTVTIHQVPVTGPTAGAPEADDDDWEDVEGGEGGSPASFQPNEFADPNLVGEW